MPIQRVLAALPLVLLCACEGVFGVDFDDAHARRKHALPDAADATNELGAWLPLPEPPAELEGRWAHTALWTGSAMLIWGGVGADGPRADGASFDPDTGWQMLPPAPIAARSGHAAVWTGQEMLIWGGRGGLNGPYFADGAAYAPTSGTWRLLPESPLSARALTSYAWAPTTHELLIWMGQSEAIPSTNSDGAGYAPMSDSWRSFGDLAPGVAPRANAASVWVGNSQIVIGGRDCDGESCPDGFAFVPEFPQSYHLTTDILGKLPDLAGRDDLETFETYERTLIVNAVGEDGAALFWGGFSGPENLSAPRKYASSGAIVTLSEMALDGGGTLTHAVFEMVHSPPEEVLPSADRAGPAVWLGAGRIWVWGGRSSDGVAHGDGTAQPLHDPPIEWSSMPGGGPSPRWGATVVWTGTDAILWGGGNAEHTGMIFRPNPL